MRTRRIPLYRHYKPKNLGMVEINGKTHYLGRHNSPESLDKYHRLIKEAMVSPAAVPDEPGADAAGSLSIDELIAAYWEQHVTAYYVKHGRPTSEQENIRQALRFLRRLYGRTPAREFGPKALKAVRQAMIEAGRCRSLINKDISRIRAVFRWAVEHEVLPVTVHQALQAVAGLRKGRSAAREAEPVGPVPLEVVEKTLPYLSPQVAAMVRLQLLTGARPGEIVAIRPCDVERPEGSEVWAYRPAEHKTEHHDRQRAIFLGPRAREVLLPWLDRSPDTNCFSPVEVVEARNARRRSGRKSSMTPSQSTRSRKTKPKRVPGRSYTRNAYRVAIQRACRKAGVPPWSPGQLRHTAATLIRSRYGLEAAQTILGHARADVTQVYAERDLTKARDIMAEIG